MAKHKNSSPPALALLFEEVRACTLCASSLPLGPRPIVRGSSTASILIVGQAPGTKVHESGVPWNDPSGERLRAWMGVDRDTFYDEARIAIMPMGFCYPGKKGGGDAPPRPECAPTWHPRLLPHFSSRKLTLLIGSYAHAGFLGERKKESLTETVRAFRDFLDDDIVVMPHPSPRNQRWLKQNPFFRDRARAGAARAGPGPAGMMHCLNVPAAEGPPLDGQRRETGNRSAGGRHRRGQRRF